jgi:hypothetical protein
LVNLDLCWSRPDVYVKITMWRTCLVINDWHDTLVWLCPVFLKKIKMWKDKLMDDKRQTQDTKWWEKLMWAFGSGQLKKMKIIVYYRCYIFPIWFKVCIINQSVITFMYNDVSVKLDPRQISSQTCIGCYEKVIIHYVNRYQISQKTYH